MPLYVYKCNDCDHQFEARQRFSEEPLTVCPKCKGQIRRVINSVGVVFKGSGFYVTDTRNGKSSSLTNGSSQTSNSDDKSDKKESKSEDSPASTATTSKADKKASAGASTGTAAA